MPPIDPKPDDTPETDAERKARHLRMLRDLSELAMELARLAAQRARAEATAGPPDPRSEPAAAKATRPTQGAGRCGTWS
jgi:hypothetical protein